MGADSETLALGDAAFVDEAFAQALDLYRSIVPPSAASLIRCAAANEKLMDWKACLADADNAISLLGPKDGAEWQDKVASLDWTNSSVKALTKKAIALYHLEKYQDARTVLHQAEQLRSDKQDQALDKWIKLCEEKGASRPNQEPDKSAVPVFSKADSKPKIRHEWYQNDQFVTISIYIKKLDPSSVSVDFAPKTLSVCIKLPTGVDYTLELDPLAFEVAPEDCKFSVLSTQVQLKLKKSVAGVQWQGLEEAEGGSIVTAAPVNTSEKCADPPVYPSSSKKKKNWDAIVKQDEEEKPEGEAALNALFQQIYKDATPETQRAMIKSFTESNGTCLSTNWDEVGTKKVDVTPPDGMIAKQFEK
ncbi:MAG: hypothetical protein SGCHY_003983 [Lobulomycetales sp.]